MLAASSRAIVNETAKANINFYYDQQNRIKTKINTKLNIMCKFILWLSQIIQREKEPIVVRILPTIVMCT